jgi:predicted kinase
VWDEALRSGSPYVVFVLGRPASGKTTLSAAIAERWNLPILSTDALKELLFDTLGSGDRAWSMKLGRAAFALLDHVIDLQLRTGDPFIVDAFYIAEYRNARFQAWQKQYGFTAVQVHCTASPDELVRRFSHRAQDGTRHPGHADHQWVEDFRNTLADGRTEVLDLTGPVLRYDSEQADSMNTLLSHLDQILPPPRHPR